MWSCGCFHGAMMMGTCVRSKKCKKKLNIAFSSLSNYGGLVHVLGEPRNCFYEGKLYKHGQKMPQAQRSQSNNDILEN